MPILDDLKAFDVDEATVLLWVFKGPSGHSSAPPRYTAFWVETSRDLDAVLRQTVAVEIGRIEETIDYGLLAQNNEGSALLIARDETNAGLVIDLVAAEVEAKRVRDAARLQNTSFYVIKLISNNAALYAVRRATGGWRARRALSARTIFFAEEMLGLDESPRFELEKTIDFFVIGDGLLILDKEHFESTLRYRQAHANDFLELQAEPDFAALFAQIAPLIEHVGVNKIRLRRMAAVREKGHFRDADFMERLRQHHAEFGLALQFDQDGRIVATVETSSQIITALLDHRLASGFSNRVYDVQNTVTVQV